MGGIKEFQQKEKMMIMNEIVDKSTGFRQM